MHTPRCQTFSHQNPTNSGAGRTRREPVGRRARRKAEAPAPERVLWRALAEGLVSCHPSGLSGSDGLQEPWKGSGRGVLHVFLLLADRGSARRARAATLDPFHRSKTLVHPKKVWPKTVAVNFKELTPPAYEYS